MPGPPLYAFEPGRPLVATSVLAVASPAWVYVLLAVLGLACLPLTALRGPSDRVGLGGRRRR